MREIHQSTIALPKARNYVAYQPGRSQLAMGLFALNLAEWIEVDEHMPAELAEKQRLLAKHHAQVFAALPQAVLGSEETLKLLTEHLPVHFPQIYQMEGSNFANKATGEIWDLTQSKLHPLELAGRLVQEDLCLMGRNPATGLYQLTGACLCFPTRWNLLEKIGQSLGNIHTPVPRYDSRLELPMDRLFDRLKENKPVWRLNWSVLDNPALFQPAGHGKTGYATTITAENAGERLWLRTERQTLRRLPASRDILFTIRIYIQPLSALNHQPENAARLAKALKGMDEDMRVYKSLSPILDAAVAWLERVCHA